MNYSRLVLCSFVIHNYVNLNIGLRLTLPQAVAYFAEWTVAGMVVGLIYKPVGNADRLAAFSRKRSGTNSDDDVRSGAIHDCLQLLLLGLRHAELVHRLLKVVEKCLPLSAGDHQRLMRILHSATGVLLRSAGRPADHFSHIVLKTRRRHPMMRFVHARVSV